MPPMPPSPMGGGAVRARAASAQPAVGNGARMADEIARNLRAEVAEAHDKLVQRAAELRRRERRVRRLERRAEGKENAPPPFNANSGPFQAERAPRRSSKAAPCCEMPGGGSGGTP